MHSLRSTLIAFASLAVCNCGSTSTKPAHQPLVAAPPPDARPAPTVDPHVNAWVEKLESPDTFERAFIELGYLQAPASIKPLAAAWRHYNHDPRVLQRIIGIADQWYQSPLRVRQVCRKAYTTDKNKCADYEQRRQERLAEIYGKEYKRGPYWDHDGNAAFNVLVEAAELFVHDTSSANARTNAEVAINAMRTAKITYDTLAKRGNFTKRPPGKLVTTLVTVLARTNGLDRKHPGQKTRLVTVRALGEFPTRPAVQALIQVLDKAKKPRSQQPRLTAAAADSLAKIALKNQTLAASATDALVVTLFAAPATFQFVSRALVAIGPAAENALIKVFKHQHPQVNRFARDHDFARHCYGAGGTQYGGNSTCQQPGNLRYKAAVVLGELHSQKALPMLVDALHDRPVPAFFARGSLPPTQHLAILVAIQKIDAHRVAGKLKSCWLGPTPKDCNRCRVNGRLAKCAKNVLPARSHCRCFTGLRSATINTYSVVTRHADDKVFAALGRYIKGNYPLALRFDAAIAYGRLARSGRSLEPLAFMVAGNRRDAARAAKRLSRAARKLAVLERVRPVTKRLRARLARLQKTVRTIKSRQADFTGFQRTFEYAVARAAVGMKCKARASCYLQFIKRRRSRNVAKLIGEVLEAEARSWANKGRNNPRTLAITLALAAIKKLKPLPGQIATWSLNDRKALTLAVAERSALEIAKLGNKAKQHTRELLQLLRTREPFIRQALLVALLHVAPRPCAACVKRLDELIARDSKSTARARLVSEATLWRNYFSWAK